MATRRDCVVELRSTAVANVPADRQNQPPDVWVMGFLDNSGPWLSSTLGPWVFPAETPATVEHRQVFSAVSYLNSWLTEPISVIKRLKLETNSPAADFLLYLRARRVEVIKLCVQFKCQEQLERSCMKLGDPMVNGFLEIWRSFLEGSWVWPFCPCWLVLLFILISM